MAAEFEAVHAELVGRWPENRIAPDLSRIRRLCDLLGEPQLTYPVIHIAGTNGKTSVARIVESLLRAFGVRTGMTTSPALRDLTERIALDGDPISARRFVETHREVAPYVALVDEESLASGGPPMTMFEVLTGMAFACFADAPAGVAVVEAGMGGRWDATNVCRSTVGVITPIALDHTDYLGSTLSAIAGEKAGIIGDGGLVVLAEQDPAALAVLMDVADERGARVRLPGLDYEVLSRGLAVGGQVMSLRVADEVFEEVFLSLHGRHQVDNAALALAAVHTFMGGEGRGLDPEVVTEGFAEVRAPGRMEVLGRHPLLLADAAHNPHGMRALAAAVPESFIYSRLVAVVAVMGDKQVPEMLDALRPVADEIVVATNGSPRALPVEDLEDLAGQRWPADSVHRIDHLPDALRQADILAGTDGCVLVTGSVVTAGVARDWARGTS